MRINFFLLAALLAIFTGCNETLPVGSEILPPEDDPTNVFSDTTTIYSWTVTEDSLRSDKLFLNQLGYTEDPIFGNTASMLTGFGIPTSPASDYIGDTIGNFFMDSVVLSLVLSRIYGDTSQLMSFTVYQFPDRIDESDLYYSNRPLPLGMIPVGRLEDYRPSLAREYSEDSTITELGPQMRIRLNPFFGQSMINVLNTAISRDEELFHNYLPGLVIVPDNDPGSIVEIDMLTTTNPSDLREALEDSRIHLYMKNGAGESRSAIFPGTVLKLGINTYEHDYSATNVETALSSTNPTGDATNYIQGLAGVKTRVDFPYIDSYGDNIAIIKAELVVSAISDGWEDVFTPPVRLFALRINDDDTQDDITDFTNFTPTHYDGFSESVVLDNGMEVVQYRINVTDHLQDVIRGALPNNGLYLTVYGAQVDEIIALNASDLVPDRIVIGGGTNTDTNIRLHLDLTYTVLD